MNELIRMLSGGSLISDGRANEVTDSVLSNPQLSDQLVIPAWRWFLLPLALLVFWSPIGTQGSRVIFDFNGLLLNMTWRNGCGAH